MSHWCCIWHELHTHIRPKPVWDVLYGRRCLSYFVSLNSLQTQTSVPAAPLSAEWRQQHAPDVGGDIGTAHGSMLFDALTFDLPTFFTLTQLCCRQLSLTAFFNKSIHIKDGSKGKKDKKENPRMKRHVLVCMFTDCDRSGPKVKFTVTGVLWKCDYLLMNDPASPRYSCVAGQRSMSDHILQGLCFYLNRVLTIAQTPRPSAAPYFLITPFRLHLLRLECKPTFYAEIKSVEDNTGLCRHFVCDKMKVMKVKCVIIIKKHDLSQFIVLIKY